MTNTFVELRNPYWDVVTTLPPSPFARGSVFSPDGYATLLSDLQAGKKDPDLTRTRTHLVKTYAWAIPSNQTIHWLATRIGDRPVLELGAGLGYWAWLLDQAGVQIVAYDKVLMAQGEKNTWFEEGQQTFFPVFRGDASVAADHPDHVLFLCWPPYSDPFAADAVRAYQGDTVIFCGEGEGGCTGDDDFFALLDKEWEEVDFHDAMTQWGGMHDFIWIYRRKTHVIEEEQA